MTNVVEIARGVVANHQPDLQFKDRILLGDWDASSPMKLAIDAVQAGINAAVENLKDAETEAENVDA